MAPTIPPSFAFDTQQVTIVISSSSSSSLVIISSSPPSPVALSSSTHADADADADDDDATSRRRYRCWDLSDELKILDTIARLRKDNMGDLTPASVLLRELQGARSPIRRGGLDASYLSQKVYHLKKKFVKAGAKAAANGGKRPRKKRNRALYEHSIEAWPELLPPAAHKARATRRLRTGSASDPHASVYHYH